MIKKNSSRLASKKAKFILLTDKLHFLWPVLDLEFRLGTVFWWKAAYNERYSQT